MPASTLREPGTPIPEPWRLPAAELAARLESGAGGLTDDEARARLARHGPNLFRSRPRTDALALLLAQLASPIDLLLVAAAVVALFAGARADALIILGIVFFSGLLGFLRERGAASAVERLLARVRLTARTLRSGAPREVPVEEVVPGDVVLLAAGDVVPADCALLEARDLFVEEAALTGEAFPVEKSPEAAPGAALLRRPDVLFMGTHVVSGTGKALAARTGAATELGRISERLRLRPAETEFERGVRRFGTLLLEVTLLLVVVILAVNVSLARPALDSLLFAVALAVGLTPQLLPAVIGVNLAHGATRMAGAGVIVKRLAAIEDFGSMSVLCCDKTGTLTEGQVRIRSAIGIDGEERETVLLHAYVNAVHETGFANPIDAAIRAHRSFDVSTFRKLDEIPYDFARKRLSVLVAREGGSLLVTKGALESVLAVSTSAEGADGRPVEIEGVRESILRRFRDLGAEGHRVMGVARREMGDRRAVTKDDEAGMTFLGMIVLADPPKEGISATLRRLRALGVSLKMITGDGRPVAASVARRIGLAGGTILTGEDLDRLSDEALFGLLPGVEVVAEVEPRHKERLVRALKKAGSVVGFLGDGVNDAPALHAADIVLLEKDLDVLIDGVREGRRTFANTLKYVFMATSANFGNMFSMAAASAFLPFLPLLPKQVLLTNVLTDFPEMAIASDEVDDEMIAAPRRWDIAFIRRFMLVFGLVSSLFDFLTFGALLLLLRASETQFRTAWFVESVVSASLIVLVVRTRRPLLRSRPAGVLVTATLAVLVATALLPFTPLARPLGFEALPPAFLLAIVGIVALYVTAAEVVKRAFYGAGAVPGPAARGGLSRER